MTAPLDLTTAARQLAERSRREQGLPERVTDPAVLRRLAVILAMGGDAA